MMDSKIGQSSNVTKQNRKKALSKGYIIIGLLFIFLIEYLLMISGGVVCVFLDLTRNFVMGLNTELSSTTQISFMFFDLVRDWFAVPTIAIIFVGTPFLCFCLMKYLYDVKQNLIEINENYKKIVENQQIK